MVELTDEQIKQIKESLESIQKNCKELEKYEIMIKEHDVMLRIMFELLGIQGVINEKIDNELAKITGKQKPKEQQAQKNDDDVMVS